MHLYTATFASLHSRSPSQSEPQLIKVNFHSAGAEDGLIYRLTFTVSTGVPLLLFAAPSRSRGGEKPRELANKFRDVQQPETTETLPGSARFYQSTGNTPTGCYGDTESWHKDITCTCIDND
ncbi:hypothetical protein AND_010325 [Anopheles darlingi]|uniref:Uncharacterized protein n=1 Tax=Anopheles darlingi TaxID=43151 RepID=W5J1M4_ANODA|nr:hypothetical protein AND_010325 [Anopheles darlingi]